MAVPELIPTNYSSDGPRMMKHNKSTWSFWFFWSGTSLGYHGQNKLIGLRRDIVISAYSDEESHLGFIWRNCGVKGGSFPVKFSNEMENERKEREIEREKRRKGKRNLTRCYDSFNKLPCNSRRAGAPPPNKVAPLIFGTILRNIQSCYVWTIFPPN